ncbi:Na+/H+ antiporter [Spirosoma linguale]|uniref:Na+/H+ antiporter n=1 Tax=Spirosoma linguale (strain ATCC 33905 / DSM 74 / LMG 10896 / Claus 1) TaxID=504472 RepID=D2QTR7_SPILD|nr:Na+/H+ antiporter [Spirosoma linguale DSM 74]
MQNLFIDYIYLILIILGLIMLANKLRLAYPIVLVLGGLVLSLVDEFSRITISPDLVFFIFLPPLLYEASWQVSWKEFWRWRRVITSFAFPIVILTSCVIALVSHALIPGFTLALGFLLGGIISPPDAISATTIMRQVNVPKSLVSIAEGESLLNDASSLIVFRFALAAVLTGRFQFQEAAASFALVVFMGIGIGLLVGVVFYAIHRWLPTTPGIDIVLTLVTPYCMYYAAEQLHFSGVLAVVSGGLLLSNKRQQMLTYQSRIQGVNVWNSLVFVLNGLVFLLIGLQLPAIVGQLGTVSLRSAIEYGLIISGVLMLTRLVCTFGAAIFTRLMSRFITVAEPNPGWKNPFILGWAGMRGVVSLAAAISIPLLTPDGQSFPHRNLILVITFIAILITLVLQGLTLPWLIRKVKPTEQDTTPSEQQQELMIQQTINQTSLQFLAENDRSNEHLVNLYEKLKLDQRLLDDELHEPNNQKAVSRLAYQRTYLNLLQQQRNALNELNRQPDIDEELIRKYLSLIDLEEYRIREKQVFPEALNEP